jgi:hypothetical protein
MKKFSIVPITSLILSGSLAYGAIFDIDLDIKITAAIQTCVGGEKIECKQVVNAIGETVKIPLSSLKIEKLDLSQATQNLKIPVIAGSKTAYSFITPGGDLAGKIIYLVFDNVAQRPGTKDFGKMVIKMYRHIKDVDKEESWTEVGNIAIENLNWSFSVTPEAVFKTGNKIFNLTQALPSRL